MESIQEIKLTLKKDHFKFNQSITLRYWKTENNKFLENPTSIAQDTGYSFREVSVIAIKSAFIIITGSCINCKENKSVSAYNQTGAKKIFHSLWECDNCISIKEKIHKQNQQVKQANLLQNRILKFEFARKHQTWKNFTFNELKIIIQMADASSLNFLLWKIIRNNRKIWSILYKAEKNGLLDLLKDERGYIIEINFLENLKQEILVYLKSLHKEIILPKQTSTTHSELGFKLIKNAHIMTEDDALYYGVISFDRDIIIKANTLYSYSVWPRANGNKWISVTPSDSILKSKNHMRLKDSNNFRDILEE
jgi:hypothetical protein